MRISDWSSDGCSSDLDDLQNLAQTLKGNWNYPTQMIFGPGRIRSLAQACKNLGMQRPLLVTDPGLAGLPMVKDAVAANAARSEERRVGEECVRTCRSRWSPHH